jgi:hypothetical protein
MALVLPKGADGLVVGIEGCWGSGKTFVINQIRAMVSEAPEPPIVVDFNPWIVSGTDALVEALLEQLGTALGAESDPTKRRAALKAGSSLLRYLSLVRHLKYLKYVPAMGSLGHIAQDVSDLADKIGRSAQDGSGDMDELAEDFEELTLRQRKDAAEQALDELGRPIVVILDDLDRLPPEEIRSVFQAVKAVADFRRTAYLLSYDPTIAARALDREVSVGLSYLEKIVQVQYPLPTLLPWRMRAFVVGKLQDALRHSDRVLTSTEEATFEETASYVARLCRTPRDAIRICNRLRISLPATQKEVDACDVMLLETLGVCAPDIAHAIRSFPEDFSGTPAVEFENFGSAYHFAVAFERSTTSDQNKNDPSWRQRVDERLNPYLEGALQFLFPKDAGDLGTLRVRNWDRLYRYLALGPSTGFLVEVKELESLLSDPKALERALGTDDVSAQSLLHSIATYLDELHLGDTVALVCLLCRTASARMVSSKSDWVFLSHQYAELIEAIIRKEHASRASLVSMVIDEAPISISQAVLAEAARDLGLWPPGVAQPAALSEDALLAPGDYMPLMNHWLMRMASVSNNVDVLRNEPSVFAALHRWGQLSGDYTAARAAARRLVRDGHDLSRFLKSTNLLGDHPVTYGHLDIVWDREDLLSVIQDESSTTIDLKKALDILNSDECKDYFARRTSKPTLNWPPGT